MRLRFLGRAIITSSLLALLVTACANAQDRERFARETGLDVDLIQVVQADIGGTELTLTFVFINDRTFDSKISPVLRAALLPYLERNAIYVNPNVRSVVSQFAFDPLDITVRTSSGGAFVPARDDWVEITPGFLGGRFEVNPAGTSQGSGSEGILVLGDAIDASEPFDVLYHGEHVTFQISQVPLVPSSSQSGGPAAATMSHDPITVPLLEDVTTLEEVLALPDFTAESMSALLGLSIDDVGTAEIEFLNDEILRLLCIRLSEGIRDGALGEDLVSTLEPLIETGAVMIWAFSPTGVAFSPWNLFIQQSETNYLFFSSASFVELTTGFIRVERIAANEMVAGVIRLPRGADPDLPFTLFYGSTGVSFP